MPHFDYAHRTVLLHGHSLSTAFAPRMALVECVHFCVWMCLTFVGVATLGTTRCLEGDQQHRLPSACEVDSEAITLCGLSKSFGMPGLRIGWLASQDLTYVFLSNGTVRVACEWVCLLTLRSDLFVKQNADLFSGVLCKHQGSLRRRCT